MKRILNHMIPITNLASDIVIALRWAEVIEEQEAERSKTGGVYGIYQDKKLVYIGITENEFEIEWRTIMREYRENSTRLYIYSLLDPEAKIEFKKLIELDNLYVNIKLTRRDLEAM